MVEEQQLHALRAANVALTGGKRREASRFASIELRASSPVQDRWELAAMTAVAVTAGLVVSGLWFL